MFISQAQGPLWLLTSPVQCRAQQTQYATPERVGAGHEVCRRQEPEAARVDRSLDRLACTDGITLALTIYRGAAVVTASDRRPATLDVNAVVRTSATYPKVYAVATELESAPTSNSFISSANPLYEYLGVKSSCQVTDILTGLATAGCVIPL